MVNKALTIALALFCQLSFAGKPAALDSKISIDSVSTSKTSHLLPNAFEGETCVISAADWNQCDRSCDETTGTARPERVRALRSCVLSCDGKFPMPQVDQ